MIFLAVIVAGAFGAVCRYLADGAFNRLTKFRIPAGTFIINISGSFAAGLVLGYIESYEIPTSEIWVTAILTGFLSSYTTFSTWMVQSTDLWNKRDLAGLTLNVAGQLCCGLLAAMAGIWIMGGF